MEPTTMPKQEASKASMVVTMATSKGGLSKEEQEEADSNAHLE